jgi:hypothetical protein
MYHGLMWLTRSCMCSYKAPKALGGYDFGSDVKKALDWVYANFNIQKPRPVNDIFANCAERQLDAALFGSDARLEQWAKGKPERTHIQEAYKRTNQLRQLVADAQQPGLNNAAEQQVLQCLQNIEPEAVHMRALHDTGLHKTVFDLEVHSNYSVKRRATELCNVWRHLAGALAKSTQRLIDSAS